MNQFEEPYMRMPFYLTYPMQNVYQTEKEYEQDMERIRELYPKRMKKLLAYVEEECDKMEYEGSMMYDEYPDPVMLYRIALNIYDKAMPMQQAQWQDDERWGDRDRRRDDRDREFLDVIQVVLFDEILRRRGRKRRCCRKWW